MESFNGAKKAKILDYYTMMPETSHIHSLSPAARQRIPIRGACNICRKPIRGSHRVKSNFICHLKRCHPAAYDEFEVRSGRKSALMSISSMDEPMGMGMVVSQMEQDPLMQRAMNALPMPPPAHIGSIAASASSTAAYSAAANAPSAIKQETAMSASPAVFPTDVLVSCHNNNGNASPVTPTLVPTPASRAPPITSFNHTDMEKEPINATGNISNAKLEAIIRRGSIARPDLHLKTPLHSRDSRKLNESFSNALLEFVIGKCNTYICEELLYCSKIVEFLSQSVGKQQCNLWRYNNTIELFYWVNVNACYSL